MAIFLDDRNVVRCLSCGSNMFSEDTKSIYERESRNKQEVLTKTVVSSSLRCCECGKHHDAIDLRKIPIIQK